jgi:SAM-dependent methyltransferase
MSSQANLEIYNAPAMASYYAALDYLTPCERLLFDSYLQPGMSILDLGVGGGRTTPYLSKVAGRYVGVDYAPEMVKICRARFPRLEFIQANAAEMPVVSDASFDAVIFSFNGLDTLAPREQLWNCLRECNRVLRVGGVFIFSSHNPRSVLIRPSWNPKRVSSLAEALVGGARPLFSPTFRVLACVRVLVAAASAFAASCRRAFQRGLTGAFWSGEGYFHDPGHPDLLNHYWTPERAVSELRRFGFQLQRKLGDDYPRTSWRYTTDWYYYVFTKTESL